MEKNRLQKVKAEEALAVARKQRRDQICQVATNKAGQDYFFRQVIETQEQGLAGVRKIKTAQGRAAQAKAEAARAEAKAAEAKAEAEAAKDEAETEALRAEWGRKPAAKHNQKGTKKA